MRIRPRGERAVLILLLLLVFAAGAVLAREAQLDPVRKRQARTFQQYVGGLGLGPGADLETCPAAVDPRLEDGCARDRGPVPGGTAFCPKHGLALLPYDSPRPTER